MALLFNWFPCILFDSNKAGYAAQDAPSTRLKITRDGPTDGPTDTPYYRDATAHLKMKENKD